MPLYIPQNTNVVSKTTTYSVTAADGLILASGSAFTVTLPTAVGVSGKQYTVKKTDSTLANIITIATTSSQTIDGALTTTLNTQYESITVASDGSNWTQLARTIPNVIGAVTPTIVGCGTVTSNAATSSRCGPRLIVTGAFASGTPTAVQLQINIGLLASGDVTVDTSRISGSTICGTSGVGLNASTFYTVLTPSANQTYVNIGAGSAGTNPLVAINGSSVIGAGQVLEYSFSVPIVGWNG